MCRKVMLRWDRTLNDDACFFGVGLLLLSWSPETPLSLIRIYIDRVAQKTFQI